MKVKWEAQRRSPLLLYEEQVPAPAQLQALAEHRYLWPKLGLMDYDFNPGNQTKLKRPWAGGTG